MVVKSFIGLAHVQAVTVLEVAVQWGRCHKAFLGINLLTLFCKLDHFINANNNCLSAVKRSSLKTRVNIFTSKMFYQIDSRILCYETFYSRNLQMPVIG